MNDPLNKNKPMPSSAEMEYIRKEAMEFAGIGLYRYTFDGIITYIDRGAMKILEIENQYATPEDVIGKSIQDLIVYATDKGFLRNKIKEDRRVRELEYEFLTLSGKRKWAIHDSFLVEDSHTGMEIIQVMIRDISKQKLDEEEREELVDQLNRSQRMEAIGQLAGGIAHDFNNILQAIQGNTEYALETLDPKSTVKDELQEIMHAAEKAGSLVHQLLSFSRREMHNPEIINLPNLISDILKMIKRVLGERIELVMGYKATDAMIFADISQIEQVMMNLCVNARDAMPEGGTLNIQVEQKELTESFCQQNLWAVPGNYVELSIADTGAGIPENIRDRIFEPFYSSKKVGEGNGLGLATVYGIVKRHDGLLNLISNEGEGTIFRLYFPAVDFHPEVVEVNAIVQSEQLQGNETILLAEDDELVRKLTIRILEGAGYTVKAAEDGLEAIKLYDQHVSEIHLCLLDIVMPKLSGRGVYEHVIKNNPHMPILFCSGHDFNILSDKLLPKDDLNLIRKPFSRLLLLTKLRELLMNRSASS